MNLGLFDAFLRKTKESGRKTWQSASRSELLFVKVDDFWGYETYHIDVLQRQHIMWMRIRVVLCTCAVTTSYEI